MSINSVAVIGSGTMGRGIAHAVALAGHPVILFDLTEGYSKSRSAPFRVPSTRA